MLLNGAGSSRRASGAFEHEHDCTLLCKSLEEQAAISENINEEFDANTTWGERIADKVAEFGGSWSFIIFFGVVIAIWIASNYWMMTHPFDPAPFIGLNLILSCLAALQAPVIMMSQNRQDAKDRLRSELDFAVNRKAETEIIQLTAKLNRIENRLDDVHEHLVKER